MRRLQEVGAKNKRVMKNAREKLGFRLHRGFAGLFDDIANGIGWLSSFGDPGISFFNVDREVYSFFHWVVASDLFDITSVAAFAAINGNDLIEGTIFSALAVESESKHNKNGLSLCGGAGNCTKLTHLPSEK